MLLSVTILIIAVLIIAILIIFGFTKIKHKLIAIFLIALILFSFFVVSSAFNGKDFSVNNISDFGNVMKVYFSWLGNIFINLKTLTGQVIKIEKPSNNISNTS